MSDENKPDPFAAFESDRTVIKPSAGRGPRTQAGAGAAPAGGAGGATGWAPPPPAAPAAAVDAASALFAELPAYASLNPLVQAAAPLLTAAPRLRAMARHPNPQALRAALADAVRRFEAAARDAHLPNEQVVAARYVLCTLLDESASSTPWGGSAWQSQSLLVQFHNEAWGGEKVFTLLTRLAENPGQHRNLLELVWVALSLGFEGRYRVLDNGRAQLDGVRERLAQLLRQGTAEPEKALSPQWQGVVQPPRRLADGIPMWAVAAIAAGVLTLIFVALRFALAVQTDATFSALQGLDAKTAAAPPAPPPQVAPPPRLAQLLGADIQAGVLEVKDNADNSVVTLRGDGLFAGGSAEVSSRFLPVFQRIAQALNQVPGQVLVTGHTDNQPIRTLRFPSNWHLSKDRAASVGQLLAADGVKPERIGAEGRADTEPVADNGSPQGRAQNRRVEVTLTVGAGR